MMEYKFKRKRNDEKLLTIEVKILLLIYFFNHDVSMLIYLNFLATLKHSMATCKFYLNCQYLQYFKNYWHLRKIDKKFRCQPKTVCENA